VPSSRQAKYLRCRASQGGERPRLSTSTVDFELLLTACAVGIITGAGVVGFNFAVHEVQDIGEFLLSSNRSLNSLVSFLSPSETSVLPDGSPATLDFEDVNENKRVWLLLLPTCGGLLVSSLHKLCGGWSIPAPRTTQAAADRTNQTNVGTFLKREVFKTTASVVTLGTGCSLGPEGPSVEIGTTVAATFGSGLSKEARVQRYALIAAGAAAGVASGFNAAVAGTFFAVEAVLRPAPSEAEPSPSLSITLVLLSAVLAATVSQIGLGAEPAFNVPTYDLRSLAELPLYLILGFGCGGISVIITKSVKVAQRLYKWTDDKGFPRWLHPISGGFLCGVIALVKPEILYQGYENLNHVLEGTDTITCLLEVTLLKVVATSLCRASGLVGGLYAPSLFIGATLGQAYGQMVSSVTEVALKYLPEQVGDILVVAPSQAYALVGMAAVLAGVCRVPLTAVLLLFELTQDFRIILPLMAGVGLSSWVASTSGGPVSLFIVPPTLYTRQAASSSSAGAGTDSFLSSAECTDVPYSVEDSLCTISELSDRNPELRSLPVVSQEVPLKDMVEETVDAQATVEYVVLDEDAQPVGVVTMRPLQTEDAAAGKESDVIAD